MILPTFGGLGKGSLFRVTSSRVTPDACVCFVVQSQKRAKLWCQHIFAGNVLEGGARS